MTQTGETEKAEAKGDARNYGEEYEAFAKEVGWKTHMASLLMLLVLCGSIYGSMIDDSVAGLLIWLAVLMSPAGVKLIATIDLDNEKNKVGALHFHIYRFCVWYIRVVGFVVFLIVAIWGGWLLYEHVKARSFDPKGQVTALWIAFMVLFWQAFVTAKSITRQVEKIDKLEQEIRRLKWRLDIRD